MKTEKTIKTVVMHLDRLSGRYLSDANPFTTPVKRRLYKTLCMDGVYRWRPLNRIND